MNESRKYLIVLKKPSGFNYKAAIVSLVKTATNKLPPCAQSGTEWSDQREFDWDGDRLTPIRCQKVEPQEGFALLRFPLLESPSLTL